MGGEGKLGFPNSLQGKQIKLLSLIKLSNTYKISYPNYDSWVTCQLTCRFCGETCHFHILVLQASKLSHHVLLLCLEIWIWRNMTKERQGFLLELSIWEPSFVDDGIWEWLIWGTIPYFQASPPPPGRAVTILWSLQDKQIRKHLNNSSEWMHT